MPELSDSQNGEDLDLEEEREAEVNRVLFIRGLSEKVTEDDLYELFLQAGPLEKVAIPQGKSIAFITYKHSVSAPYAKEVFCDTKLHGRMLNIDFRTGSIHHGGTSGQNRQGNYNHSRQARETGNSGHNTHNRSYQSQRNSNDNYAVQGRQNGIFPYPTGNFNAMGYVANTSTGMSPFSASPMSMPQQGIQGYRSSANNREYVPQYVSFENPPTQFRGGVPINHPNHPVALEERRERLLHQQHYVSQADIQRNQQRRDYRR